MNKRYWFVVADYKTTTEAGKFNLGVTSSDGTHFSNKEIRELISKQKGLSVEGLVVVNFFEFKSESDYNDFWEKY